MPAPRLNTPVDILRAALSKEHAARDFYARLAIHCSVEPVRDLLQRLQNEEEKHAALIQRLLARIAAGRDPT